MVNEFVSLVQEFKHNTEKRGEKKNEECDARPETHDGRCVAGAGSTEVQLSLFIEQYGSQCPGLEQYAIKKFSESLRVFPKVSFMK
ncbi:T-complex protein 1 subunit theta [Portunus trituberculatus]|uniref:T-complex protein 1 subunit theta n=1 Tax=Portunus trituberculatus TaxID=210409 RepID=A0A5B7IYJ4_PORTR|nr:T-complex protein 1 subunit theta [Portunus trituberculatus]